jgi:hypothetical protein
MRETPYDVQGGRQDCWGGLVKVDGDGRSWKQRRRFDCTVIDIDGGMVSSYSFPNLFCTQLNPGSGLWRQRSTPIVHLFLRHFEVHMTAGAEGDGVTRGSNPRLLLFVAYARNVNGDYLCVFTLTVIVGSMSFLIKSSITSNLQFWSRKLLFTFTAFSGMPSPT